MIYFDPRALWVGVHWESNELYRLRLTICAVPCFPLSLNWTRFRDRLRP